MPLVLMVTCNVNLKHPSHIQKQKTSFAPLVKLKRIWKKNDQWIGFLCGDVGYGKTEVAIRAAFKAIADGKQVAILVPTTILSTTTLSNYDGKISRIILLKLAY